MEKEEKTRKQLLNDFLARETADRLAQRVETCAAKIKELEEKVLTEPKRPEGLTASQALEEYATSNGATREELAEIYEEKLKDTAAEAVKNWGEEVVLLILAEVEINTGETPEGRLYWPLVFYTFARAEEMRAGNR